MPFDSNTGSAAGKMTSRGPNKPVIKLSSWQKLALSVTGKQTTNVIRYQAELWRSGQKDKYFDNYMQMLSYIKPRLQATAIKQETEITIKLVHPDQDLMEKV